MQRKSKLLFLFLTLALLCSLFMVFASAKSAPSNGALIDSREFPAFGKGTGTNGDSTYLDSSALIESNIYRYLAITKDDPGITNADAFFQWTAFGSFKATDAGTYKYLTMDMDISFEEIPAAGRALFILQGGLGSTNSQINILNTDGKMQIQIGGVTYPKLYEPYEWAHVTVIIGTSTEGFANYSAAFFVDGEPVTTTAKLWTGTATNTTAFRVFPAASNTPGATLLFRNYRSYKFEDSTDLADLLKGEKSLRVSADTHPDVIYDNTYSVSYTRPNKASVNGTAYATLAEALAAANGKTVTLNDHTIGGEITTPCIIDTNGKYFPYTTSLEVTKDGNVLTFAEGENVLTYRLEFGTRTEEVKFGLGSVADMSDRFLPYQEDASHLYTYHVTSSTDENGDTVTLPAGAFFVTEEMLGHTYTVKVEEKLVYLTRTRSGVVTYFYSAEEVRDAFDATVAGDRYRFETNVQLKAPTTQKADSYTNASIYFDLNGQTVTLASGAVGFVKHKCRNNTYYFYSSKEGGVLDATAAKALIWTYGRKVQYVFGAATVDGKTYPGSNLTVKMNILGSFGTPSAALTDTVTFDGGTYIKEGGTDPLTGGMKQSLITFIVNIKNAKFYVASGTLFAADQENFTMNIENSDMYIDGGFFSAGGATAGTVNIRDSRILGASLTKNEKGTAITVNVGANTYVTSTKADDLLLADGCVLARTSGNDSYNGKSYTLGYAVLPTDKTASLTFLDGNTTETERWEIGATPTKANVTLADGYYKTYGTLKTVNGDAEYTAKLLSSVPKIKGNLTLYSSITLNLYIAKDTLAKTVTFDGGETVELSTLDVVTIGETEYYVYHTSEKAPKDFVAAFTVAIGLGETGTYRVKSSLVKYADSVLENTKSEASRTLVKALLDYVREVALKFGTAKEDDLGIRAIDGLLGAYPYSRPTWKAENVQDVNGGEVLTGAALNLDSTPGFLFFVKEDFAGEITVSYDNVTETYLPVTVRYRGEHRFAILVDLPASAYRALITVTAGGESLTYNLDTYIESQKTENGAPAYLEALYAYSVAAEAYLAEISGN